MMIPLISVIDLVKLMVYKSYVRVCSSASEEINGLTHRVNDEPTKCINDPETATYQ